MTAKSFVSNSFSDIFSFYFDILHL